MVEVKTTYNTEGHSGIPLRSDQLKEAKKIADECKLEHFTVIHLEGVFEGYDISISFSQNAKGAEEFAKKLWDLQQVKTKQERQPAQV